MDISMDIHETSVDMDMDMDVIFHIHGNPGIYWLWSQEINSSLLSAECFGFAAEFVYGRRRSSW